MHSRVLLLQPHLVWHGSIMHFNKSLRSFPLVPLLHSLSILAKWARFAVIFKKKNALSISKWPGGDENSCFYNLFLFQLSYSTTQCWNMAIPFWKKSRSVWCAISVMFKMCFMLGFFCPVYSGYSRCPSQSLNQPPWTLRCVFCLHSKYWKPLIQTWSFLIALRMKIQSETSKEVVR